MFIVCVPSAFGSLSSGRACRRSEAGNHRLLTSALSENVARENASGQLGKPSRRREQISGKQAAGDAAKEHALRPAEQRPCDVHVEVMEIVVVTIFGRHWRFGNPVQHGIVRRRQQCEKARDRIAKVGDTAAGKAARESPFSAASENRDDASCDEADGCCRQQCARPSRVNVSRRGGENRRVSRRKKEANNRKLPSGGIAGRGHTMNVGHDGVP